MLEGENCRRYVESQDAARPSHVIHLIEKS
jgi:hypothetical protein